MTGYMVKHIRGELRQRFSRCKHSIHDYPLELLLNSRWWTYCNKGQLIKQKNTMVTVIRTNKTFDKSKCTETGESTRNTVDVENWKQTFSSKASERLQKPNHFNWTINTRLTITNVEVEIKHSRKKMSSADRVFASSISHLLQQCCTCSGWKKKKKKKKRKKKEKKRRKWVRYRRWRSSSSSSSRRRSFYPILNWSDPEI